MKPGFKSLTGLLAILGIGDLAIVPSMIAANHHTAGTPPVPAIVATVIIGIATLVSAAGIARGWKRAFAVAMTCRIIDSISSALGLLAHPSALLVTTGALGLVLSVTADRPARQAESTQGTPPRSQRIRRRQAARAL